MELETKETKKTKRGTHGLVVHVTPAFKEKLTQFTVERNIGVSDLVRMLLAQHMVANGCELPDGSEVSKQGRRPSKKESTAVESA